MGSNIDVIDSFQHYMTVQVKVFYHHEARVRELQEQIKGSSGEQREQLKAEILGNSNSTSAAWCPPASCRGCPLVCDARAAASGAAKEVAASTMSSLPCRDRSDGSCFSFCKLVGCRHSLALSCLWNMCPPGLTGGFSHTQVNAPIQTHLVHPSCGLGRPLPGCHMFWTRPTNSRWHASSRR